MAKIFIDKYLLADVGVRKNANFSLFIFVIIIFIKKLPLDLSFGSQNNFLKLRTLDPISPLFTVLDLIVSRIL